MESLTLISLIIGILVGIIALLEKFFHILPRNRGSKKLFENEFSLWKESGFSHVSKHDDLRRFGGYVLKGQLNGERNTFALLCAIQHGDKLMHELISKIQGTSAAIPFIFDFVSGRGIRVGWRAEYALSRIKYDQVAKFIDHLPNESKNSKIINEAIQRILENRVEDFLQEKLKGDDRKLRIYANEVLNQIQSKFAPRPQK